jgi:PAS domain S-box-containing protein
MVQGFHSAKEQLQIAQIETFLKDFGFNNREVAIYMALCKAKKAAPAEISKLSNVERSDAYRILNNLVAKGFVVKILEKPVQYALAPPDKAFKRNLEEKRRNLSALERQVEDSNKIIFDFIGTTDSQADANRFEVIKSRQYVYERFAEMFSAERCQKEVLFYGTDKCAGRLLYNLKDVITYLQKRHIDFKIMLPINKKNLEAVKALSQFADVKHLQQTRGRAIIVDRKESMLVYTASEDENASDDLGLWLNNPQFAAMQAELFDAQWKLAMELHNKVDELEAPPIETYTEEQTMLVFTIDSKGKVTFISPIVDPELSSSIQTYIGALSKGLFTEFFHEDQEKARNLWSTSRQGIGGKNEFQSIKKNGAPRWWAVSWLPIFGKNGAIKTLRVVLKDITNSKKLELIEKELVRSKELLVRSQEIAHLGSWEFDLINDRVYFSDEVYRIVGLPLEDKVESFKAFLELMSSYGSLYNRVQDLLQNSSMNSFDIEEQITRKVGVDRFVHLKGEIIRDVSGRVVESIGIIHDITELKNVQQALIESEARYRLQFEEATDAILLADIETGLIVDCNRAATQLIGYTREELVGKSQKTIHPDNNQSFEYRIKSPQKPVTRKILTKSGEIRDVEIRAAIFELNGKRVIQGIFRDITEEKRVTETVRRSKYNYETFFDDINDFLYVLDDQGKLLQINNAFILRLGYTRDELLGQSILMVYPPEFRDEAELVLKKILTGVTDTFSIPLITKDGKLVLVETNMTRGEWNGEPVMFGVSKEENH